MKINVIDYIGNGGGGLRFTVEALKGLVAVDPLMEICLVSHGAALESYRSLLAREGIACNFRDVVPEVGPGEWHYVIPDAAVAEADVAWLPWVHRHRIAPELASRVVGSFHDAIILTEPSLQSAFAHVIPDEWETTRRWLGSDARLVVSANATVSTMASAAGVLRDRFTVIPISGAHVRSSLTDTTLPHTWGWSREDFLLCPANITAHKNHEVLLEGFAMWGQKRRLVLTGSAADLPVSRSLLKRYARALLEPIGVVEPNRSTFLRRFATRRGVRLGDTLIPVGYVSDEVYYSLLERAWAVVMPTRAEGGGSFPVEEAVRAGIPVIASDIPVIREHMERLGADVLWFDPRNPRELRDRLHELETDYPRWREHAVRQVSTLTDRTWMDVAAEYAG
ncbi:MAG: glycosyltransferase, partial [Gemmatimonadaceae bacterium]